ncbi:hypothetical protein CKAN_00467500 [Cinnamomum micranthum f. kanehirae]|uniref:Pentatricopeptide repeat-containing protein n=1 Tax=Cinnamomum micranthum f. kanehirae TaxID=337451 RepID=A0A443NCL3_9MAGN|nr:hypothetical protein CKAN_00467500 [Cinnamomum micranthum f. kanehirae]
MWEAGVKPNLMTYNTVIGGALSSGGLCLVGRVKEAKAVLEEMKEQGLAPDGCTCSILFDGYSRLGDSDALVGFFEETMEKGIQIGDYPCSVLLNGHCNEWKVSVAEGL